MISPKFVVSLLRGCVVVVLWEAFHMDGTRCWSALKRHNRKEPHFWKTNIRKSWQFINVGNVLQTDTESSCLANNTKSEAESAQPPPHEYEAFSIGQLPQPAWSWVLLFTLRLCAASCVRLYPIDCSRLCFQYLPTIRALPSLSINLDLRHSERRRLYNEQRAS